MGFSIPQGMTLEQMLLAMGHAPEPEPEPEAKAKPEAEAKPVRRTGKLSQ